MADFLLELLSEEIPARMQGRARNDLGNLFVAAMESAGLAFGVVQTFSTPRRLVLIARDVAGETQAGREEIKGPKAAAPAQALEGFLRKTGLRREQLDERDGVLFAVIERAGRPAADVIADAVSKIVADFPWPKSMRWGGGEMRWVRPLHGIVAMLGEAIVPLKIGGIASGAATVGHRFHHPGAITIGGAGDYAEKLRACHVIVDQAERERLIRDGAAKAAADAGLTLLADDGLVAENAGLTEWPVPLLGRFDENTLDVPREVIVLTMRTNQKYFACADDSGALAPAFVCVANIDANDGGEAIVEGNRRVLAARLSDARFFWEQDLKVLLEEQAKKLGGIVFHEKLGTVADKVERVAKLARWLVEEGIVKGADVEQVERAARLAKADLVTGMVGEFPELQGVIGGYLARAQGEPAAVADAIRDHYKPVGQGDDVPTAPVTVAVALADKLDTLAAFFAANEIPTGSKDPFGLRRSGLAVLSILNSGQLRILMHSVLRVAVARVIDSVMRRTAEGDPNYALYVKKVMEVRPDRSLPDDEFEKRMKAMADALGEFEIVLKPETEKVFEFLQRGGAAIREAPGSIFAFLIDRLKVQQRGAGVRHDLIDAVFALGAEDDLVRLLARVTALQGFVETGEGGDLLAGYKRAANILKKEQWEGEGRQAPDQVRGDDLAVEERALMDALEAAEPMASAAVEAEDFTGAMAALASLRAPIDTFFDKVTVNDPDPAKRERRLDLLLRFRDAVHRVADFSKIEG